MQQLLPYAFAAVCLLSTSLNAQIRRAYTSGEYNLDLSLVDSTFRQTLSLLERESYASYYEPNVEEVTISVVFHVLHTSLFDRVSEAQLRSQLEVLNQDFGEPNLPEEDARDPLGTFRDLAANPKIKFCTPYLDPAGNRTNGINVRLVPAAILNNLLSIKDGLLGLAPWSARRYLNIWVVPLPDGIGGFAQLPGGSPLTDGIVIDPRYLGTEGMASAPFNGGRTLTHLVGNYLGLKDIWGNGGCSDDGVADTPVHNAPNWGRPGVGHTSTCDGYPAEMTMNFMDNTDDAGVYMFTAGQVKRMRWVLSERGLRPGLSSAVTACDDDKTSREAVAPSPAAQAPPATIVEMGIYPNPSTGLFTVYISDYEDERLSGTLDVIDLTGKVIHQRQTNTQRLVGGEDINAGNWPAGTYLIRMTLGERRWVKRIVIQ